MPYDGIVFDMDGVLVTGSATIPRVYRRATRYLLRAFGVADRHDEWTIALQNPSDAAAFRDACDRWGLPPESAWGYREKTASQLEFKRIENRERRAFKDTAVIPQLAKHHTLGICSNNRHETVADAIKSFGWDGSVEAFRGRFPTLAEYDQLKPDPTFLSWTIERMDVEEPLFVGDRLSDVKTADHVGCDAALLSRDGEHPDGAVEPTYRIDTLEDLPGLVHAGSNPPAESS